MSRIPDGYSATTFTVDPINAGKGSTLTITTDFNARRGGIMGRLDRYLTGRVLTRIYVKELQLMAAYANDLELESWPA